MSANRSLRYSGGSTAPDYGASLIVGPVTFIT